MAASSSSRPPASSRSAIARTAGRTEAPGWCIEPTWVSSRSQAWAKAPLTKAARAASNRSPYSKRVLVPVPPSSRASRLAARLHGIRAPTATTRRRSSTSAFILSTTASGASSSRKPAAHSARRAVVPLPMIADMRSKPSFSPVQSPLREVRQQVCEVNVLLIPGGGTDIWQLAFSIGKITLLRYWIYKGITCLSRGLFVYDSCLTGLCLVSYITAVWRTWLATSSGHHSPGNGFSSSPT